MVRAPSPEEEDRRRLTRERGTLLKERIQHANRIRGLLSGHGIPGLDGLTLRIQTPKSMHNAEMNELDWKHPM